MFKIGLKLWSNNDAYIPEARKLYEKKTYDYIELYIVPQTFDGYVKLWENLNIPFIIHCAHSIHGFNLAAADKIENNLRLFSEARNFCDQLKSQYIIIHPGIEGTLEESIQQINSLRDERLLVENKPHISMHGEYCRGSTFVELQKIIDSCGIGFCLDIPHAFNTALNIKKDYVAYTKELLSLSPKLIHISDGKFSEKHETHLNIGEGEFDFEKIRKIIVNSGVQYVTLETRKKNNGLFDFVNDLNKIRKLFNNVQEDKDY